ncbi:hypothetical protein CHARACLAT_032366 [Characodon lateralis]|uniref:Uncharacterized protein n=1 Tax=Characodon lateralis TaxID=208331 RepID=A0ABU7D5W6_9TELE|nr:hypothetical protein [Characodon lateralis]
MKVQVPIPQRATSPETQEEVPFIPVGDRHAAPAPAQTSAGTAQTRITSTQTPTPVPIWRVGHDQKGAYLVQKSTPTRASAGQSSPNPPMNFWSQQSIF